MNRVPRATDHFKKRIKERSGIPASAAENYLRRALKNGISETEAANKSKLYNYICSIKREGYYIVIYGRNIIIFSEEGDVAVTLLHLPKELYSAVDDVMNKRKGVLKKHHYKPRREDDSD